MTITGEIHFRGFLRLDGTVEGALRGDQLELGATGRFTGEADLQQLNCHGTINGRVTANRVHLYQTARVAGSVAAEELSMAAGAVLDVLIGVGGTAALADSAHTEQLPATAPAAPVEQVTDGNTTEPADGNAPDDVIDSLVGAIQGGSRLVVAVSDNLDERAGFCRLARSRLGDFYRVIVIDSPGGSVRDILLGIGRQLAVELPDQSSSTTIWHGIQQGLDSGRDGQPCLLLIENGETMFPATLEGILRLFAETTDGPAPPLILTGTSDLKKLQDLDSAAASFWEPDCLFELPSP
jgi:cytoskeletal protein CcmA (bactofilin family)